MGDWEHNWQINQGSIDMLATAGKPTKFELAPVSGGGSGFEVKFNDSEMNAGWNGCVLEPRGTEPLTWEGEKLDPFEDDPITSIDYADRIDDHVAKLNDATHRLEGTWNSGGKSKRVSLYLARGAIQANESETKDLLIVLFPKVPEASAPGIVRPIEDGTGHGNRT